MDGKGYFGTISYFTKKLTKLDIVIVIIAHRKGNQRVCHHLSVFFCEGRTFRNLNIFHLSRSLRIPEKAHKFTSFVTLNL